MNLNSQLDKILFKGVLEELTKAEKYWALGEEIARNAHATNRSRVAGLFGDMQRLYAGQITLALCRAFEPTSPNYPIRSIPAALDFLNTHASNLRIIRKDFVLGKLASYGLPESELAGMSDVRITRAVHSHFVATLPTIKNPDELSQSLVALKSARDKSLAHREAIEIQDLPKTSYKNVYRLIQFVREFLEIVGSGYTDLNYSSDPDWFAASSAQKLASDLKWLLLRARIVNH